VIDRDNLYPRPGEDPEEWARRYHADDPEAARALGESLWLLNHQFLVWAVREAHDRLDGRGGEPSPAAICAAVEHEWWRITEASPEEPFPWNDDHVIRVYEAVPWGEFDEGVDGGEE
jgi:hypothetical protein